MKIKVALVAVAVALTIAASSQAVVMGAFTASGDFEFSSVVVGPNGPVTAFSITKHFEDDDGRMVIECASVQCEVIVSTLKPGQYVVVAGVDDADKNSVVTHRAMDVARQ